jgi:hypothetical protein
VGDHIIQKYEIRNMGGLPAFASYRERKEKGVM